MKSYVHNPEIFRRHFKGKALPAFKGQRIQRGRGVGFTYLKRLAAPLLGAIAPHIAGTASKLASKAVKKAFPNHPMMQTVVGSVVKAGTNAAVRSVQKKRKSTTSSRTAKKRKRTHQRNIFSNK